MLPSITYAVTDLHLGDREQQRLQAGVCTSAQSPDVVLRCNGIVEHFCNIHNRLSVCMTTLGVPETVLLSGAGVAGQSSSNGLR